MEEIQLKPGQAIRLGNEVQLVVLAVRGNNVQLGLDAPRTVSILRSELAPLRHKRSSKSDNGQQRAEAGVTLCSPRQPAPAL